MFEGALESLNLEPLRRQVFWDLGQTKAHVGNIRISRQDLAHCVHRSDVE